MSSLTVACIPWSLKHMALAVVFHLLLGAICPASILHLLWINWCFLFLSPVLEYCLCEDNSSFLETPWSKLSLMFIHSFLLITLLLQAQERSQGTLPAWAQRCTEPSHTWSCFHDSPELVMLWVWGAALQPPMLFWLCFPLAMHQGVCKALI